MPEMGEMEWLSPVSLLWVPWLTLCVVLGMLALSGPQFLPFVECKSGVYSQFRTPAIQEAEP